IVWPVLTNVTADPAVSRSTLHIDHAAPRIPPGGATARQRSGSSNASAQPLTQTIRWMPMLQRAANTEPKFVHLLKIGRTRPLPIRDALISSLSAMFALMVAFSAAGIWSDAIQARGAVQREANSIENVVAIASSFPEEFREEVHREILRYARRAVQRDWPAMRRRETPYSNVASRHECSGFDH